jgi:hypothetical protein
MAAHPVVQCLQDTADWISTGSAREGQRWIEGYEQLAESAASLLHTRRVYIADHAAVMVVLVARAAIGHAGGLLDSFGPQSCAV